MCWKFEGKKYSLAKKFDTIVVNHQWVEECIREGRRVSEAPYMFERFAYSCPVFLFEMCRIASRFLEYDC